MASSGDELDSYEQSPRVPVLDTSKVIAARPVAGPSKAAPKRKKASTSDTADAGKHKVDVVEAIAISSDEDDVRSTKRGKTPSTARPASNGRATGARGKGRTAAVAKSKKIADQFEVDLVEDSALETEEDGATRRDKTRHATVVSSGKTHDLLQKQIERLQRQLGDISGQRDSMAAQLEELFQLRHTEAEAQLAEQKVQYKATLKAKEDTIDELNLALSNVDKLPKSGTATTLHFLTRETADEEKREVQREVAKLKDALKKRDEIIHAKDAEIADLNETVKVLRADLKTEIENTKTLSSRNPPAVKHASKAADAKNALAIRLYEELTNLLVTNVRHEPGKFREDDAIYTCVQTTISGKSLNFSLRFYKDAEEGETPSSANKNRRIVDKVIYTPMLLEKEPQEFVQQLDFLANPFTFHKVQMGLFTKTLMTYLEGEGEDSQSNAGQMEVEAY